MESHQSQSAKFFAAAVILVGALTIAWGLNQWDHPDLGRLATYCFVTVAASRMKIQLPSVKGTLSVSFLFAFVGILELSLAEAMLLGIISVLTQSLFPKHSKTYQIGFSVANNCFAIAVVYWLRSALAANFTAMGTPLILAASAICLLAIASVCCLATASSGSTSAWVQARWAPPPCR